MHDIKAIGRKFDTSSVGPFLCIRMVVAVFQMSGTSRWRMQCPKILANSSPFGSMTRRWRYSTRSLPGAELDIIRSLALTSAAVGGSNRDSSIGKEGTCSWSSLASVSVLQCLWLKTFVKKVFASSKVPLYMGLSLARTLRAARLREWR